MSNIKLNFNIKPLTAGNSVFKASTYSQMYNIKKSASMSYPDENLDYNINSEETGYNATIEEFEADFPEIFYSEDCKNYIEKHKFDEKLPPGVTTSDYVMCVDPETGEPLGFNYLTSNGMSIDQVALYWYINENYGEEYANHYLENFKEMEKNAPTGFQTKKVENEHKAPFVGPVRIINAPENLSKEEAAKIRKHDYDQDGVVDYSIIPSFYNFDNIPEAEGYDAKLCKFEEEYSNIVNDILNSEDFKQFSKYRPYTPIPGTIVDVVEGDPIEDSSGKLYPNTNYLTSPEMTEEQNELYWYIYENYGENYANDYLDGLKFKCNPKRQTMRKNIKALFASSDLTKDMWSEKLDSEWHYSSIEDLNVSDSEKQDIKTRIDEANKTQNALNILTDAINKGIKTDESTGYYKIIVDEKEISFSDINEAILYLDTLKELQKEYEELFNSQKDSIISDMRSLHIEHYKSIMETQDYKDFIKDNPDPDLKAEDFKEFSWDIGVPNYLWSGTDAGWYWMTDEEKLLLLYIRQKTDDIGAAEEYYFRIEEIVNQHKAFYEYEKFVESLKYSDLIYLQDEFPNIENSDEFEEYINTHDVKDVPGNGVKHKEIETKTMPDNQPHDIPVEYYEPYTDKQKQMYWYLHDNEKYGPEAAEYYLKYLDGDGDLEDVFSNHLATIFEGGKDGIRTYLDNIDSLFGAGNLKNHSVMDYKRLYIATYLSVTSPTLEKEYNISEKIGEAMVPAVVAIATSASTGGAGIVSGSQLFSIMVGLGDVGAKLHENALNGYTSWASELNAGFSGVAKSIMIVALTKSLEEFGYPSEVINIAKSIIIDVFSKGASDVLAKGFEQVMTGTKFSFETFEVEERADLMKLALLDCVAKGTSLVIKVGSGKEITLTKEMVLNASSEISGSKTISDVMTVIAKTAGVSISEYSGEVPIEIAKGTAAAIA